MRRRSRARPPFSNTRCRRASHDRVDRLGGAADDLFNKGPKKACKNALHTSPPVSRRANLGSDDVVIAVELEPRNPSHQHRCSSTRLWGPGAAVSEIDVGLERVAVARDRSVPASPASAALHPDPDGLDRLPSPHRLV